MKGFKIISKLCDRKNYIEFVLRNLKEHGKKVVIYGAGYCGHETIALLRAQGIPVVAAYDDYAGGGYRWYKN